VRVKPNYSHSPNLLTDLIQSEPEFYWPTSNKGGSKAMGDRANICNIYDHGEKIYFYTHWDGSNLPQVLRNALAKRMRWDDPPYLSRIIFSEMIKNNVSDEHGYGIAPYEPDNNHTLIEVHHYNKKVVIGNMSWTFEEYVNQQFTVPDDY
jgi:hypothetical protein